MKMAIVFLNALFLAACSSHKNTLSQVDAATKPSYQVKLNRFVLARPPETFSSSAIQPEDEFSTYSDWVAKYPKMAELSILSGFFQEGNCEIAIEDGNKDGKYDSANKDFLHLLYPKADFSELWDLYSNSVALQEMNYFKVNGKYYSVKSVENDGPSLIITEVDSISMDRCMFFADDIPADRIALQEIESKRTVLLGDILSGSKKKYTVLSFWATYCEPCIHEIPTLNKAAAYANLVTLCNNESSYDGDITEFIKEKKMVGLHCKESKNASRLFCQNGMPSLVILDAQGRILLKTTDADEVLDYVKGH